VSSIELTLKEHFNRLELELPYDTIDAGMTAAETLKLLLKNQGGFVEGDPQVAFNNLRDIIVQMCSRDDKKHKEIADQATAEVVVAQKECQRLSRLVADRDKLIEAIQKKYEEELEVLRKGMAKRDSEAVRKSSVRSAHGDSELDAPDRRTLIQRVTSSKRLSGLGLFGNGCNSAAAVVPTHTDTDADPDQESDQGKHQETKHNSKKPSG
jgi:hypothetical protein